MSKRQKEILEVIKTFIKENGYSPTVREICSIANIKSTSTVHGDIQRLMVILQVRWRGLEVLLLQIKKRRLNLL